MYHSIALPEYPVFDWKYSLFKKQNSRWSTRWQLFCRSLFKSLMAAVSYVNPMIFSVALANRMQIAFQLAHSRVAGSVYDAKRPKSPMLSREDHHAKVPTLQNEATWMIRQMDLSPQDYKNKTPTCSSICTDEAVLEKMKRNNSLLYAPRSNRHWAKNAKHNNQNRIRMVGRRRLKICLIVSAVSHMLLHGEMDSRIGGACGESTFTVLNIRRTNKSIKHKKHPTVQGWQQDLQSTGYKKKKTTKSKLQIHLLALITSGSHRENT